MEIQLWRSILCPYELAVKELTVKFKHMIEEYHENDRYSPIEQVSGRVKSVSSILEKMQRKDIPIEQLETEMEDLAGVRIICQFEEDIDTVAAIIRKRTDMEVKSEKNYQAERLPELSHDPLLYSGDYSWAETASGRNTDPYHGNEFLGNDRTFPSV